MREVTAWATIALIAAVALAVAAFFVIGVVKALGPIITAFVLGVLITRWWMANST